MGLPPACFVEIFTEEEIVSINTLPKAIRPYNHALFQKAKKNYIKFDAKMSNFIFRAHESLELMKASAIDLINN